MREKGSKEWGEGGDRGAGQNSIPRELQRTDTLSHACMYMYMYCTCTVHVQYMYCTCTVHVHVNLSQRGKQLHIRLKTVKKKKKSCFRRDSNPWHTAY